MFRSSHFWFLVFGHFWRQSYENTKILCNLCLHFERQDGQDRNVESSNIVNKQKRHFVRFRKFRRFVKKRVKTLFYQWSNLDAQPEI